MDRQSLFFAFLPDKHAQIAVTAESGSGARYITFVLSDRPGERSLKTVIVSHQVQQSF